MHERAMCRRMLLLLGLALCCCAPPAALAEQRALLVGVGKLDIPGNDLPSIELDLDRMHEMLNLMGSRTGRFTPCRTRRRRRPA
jgi:hypothetical protein